MIKPGVRAFKRIIGAGAVQHIDNVRTKTRAVIECMKDAMALHGGMSSWSNLVEGVLQTGASLSPETMLGEEGINNFGRGKLWIPATAPAASVAPAAKRKWGPSSVVLFKKRSRRLHSMTRSIPAAHSVLLGSGMLGGAEAGPIAMYIAGNAQAETVGKSRLKSQADMPVQRLLSSQVMPSGDGPKADPTAIVQAVAAGHTAVAAQLLSSSTGPFLQLFSHYDQLAMTLKRPTLAPNAKTLPIFAEDAAQVMSAIQTMPALSTHTARFVDGIRLGRLNVTTVDSDWAGIQGGRNVRLDVLLVETTPALSDVQGVQGLSALVQEVAAVFTADENRDLAEQLLDRHYFAAGGKSPPPKSVTC